MNALYCYLRVKGYSCDYPALVNLQDAIIGSGQPTAASLAECSRRSGCLLQPVSLNLKQLADCPLPVIVHMDGDSPQVGAFLLVFAVSKDRVTYLNGPSATIQDITREDFSRIWSGVAFLPESQRRRNLTFYLSGVGIGGACSLLLLYVSRGHKAQTLHE